MSTAVLDERDQRHALVRAQAAAIADAPRPPRRFSVAPGTVLRPSPRKRSSTKRHIAIRVPHLLRMPRLPHVRIRAPRRLIAGAVLLVQLTLLLLALTLPAFRVQHVTLTGARLISTQSVLSSAAVPQQSIFTIDADAIRSRIVALPWVQDATVITELPNSVRISVVERTPAIRLRRGGADVYVAGNGATLPADPRMRMLWLTTPVVIDLRAGSAEALDANLVQLLGAAAQRFPAVFGCRVAAYEWSPDGVFSIWTTRGWRAVLGHVDTQDGLAQVPAQLSALADLRTRLHLLAPAFGYINLENAASPAVGGKPGVPAEVSAARYPISAASAPVVAVTAPFAMDSPPGVLTGSPASPASG